MAKKLIPGRTKYLIIQILFATVELCSQNMDCLSLIREANLYIESNPAKATELLREAIDRCESSFKEAEDLRWKVADINYVMANRVADRCQQYELADLAIQEFMNYIQWYDGLSVEQKNVFSNEDKRIQFAVQRLGNAVIIRGQPGSCREHASTTGGIRELFSLYKQIPAIYFSSASMTLWKEWLWRCPSWAEDVPRSYARISKIYCSQEEYLDCENEWSEYRDRLENWLRTKGGWYKEGRERNPQIDITYETIKSAERELSNINKAFMCD